MPGTRLCLFWVAFFVAQLPGQSTAFLIGSSRRSAAPPFAPAAYPSKCLAPPLRGLPPSQQGCQSWWLACPLLLAWGLAPLRLFICSPTSTELRLVDFLFLHLPLSGLGVSPLLLLQVSHSASVGLGVHCLLGDSLLLVTER